MVLSCASAASPFCSCVFFPLRSFFHPAMPWQSCARLLCCQPKHCMCHQGRAQGSLRTRHSEPRPHKSCLAHTLYLSQHILHAFDTVDAMQPGVHRRAWCAVNDHCSNKGPVWRCKNCILMEPVMQVPSRGTNLQATFQSAATPAPGIQLDVQVDLRGVDWLQFKGEGNKALSNSTALSPPAS